jgi:hypothetical protein
LIAVFSDLCHSSAIGAIALAIAFATGLFSWRLPDGYPQPQGAIEFMQAERLHGNVLGDFGWGEYLIFRLAPESKVFIDSRYDMVYPQAVLADYLTSSLCTRALPRSSPPTRTTSCC